MKSGKEIVAIARPLLEKGYPVRAMVRTTDQRSEKLRKLGEEIFVGNLADITERSPKLWDDSCFLVNSLSLHWQCLELSNQNEEEPLPVVRIVALPW